MDSRIPIAIAITTASSLFALPARAFEPIPFAKVAGLVGKTVFAGGNQGLEGERYMYAGEPLTLVKAERWGDEEPIRYNYVTVRNAEGVQGEVQIQYLSLAPLKYNLRKPGKAKDLLKNAFADAFPLAARIHEIRLKHAYDLHDMNGPNAEDYHLVEAMEASYKFSGNLVHNLIYSSNYAKDDLMRQGPTKWLAMADDDTILEWYSDGIKDARQKDALRVAKDALSTLEHVSHHGFNIARAEQEKKERPWRRDMDGIPEAKLAKLDRENMGRLDKDIKEAKGKIAAAFQEAAKLKGKVR